MQALEVLWEQAHASEMPKLLMEQALEEHLGILSNASIFATKDQLKKTYVYKCVDDIREGRWVLPALRHLLEIAKSIAKQGFNKSDRVGCSLALNL
jgi:ubiquitin carboxyl-terminal hydrolase 9/24